MRNAPLNFTAMHCLQEARDRKRANLLMDLSSVLLQLTSIFRCSPCVASTWTM